MSNVEMLNENRSKVGWVPHRCVPCASVEAAYWWAAPRRPCHGLMSVKKSVSKCTQVDTELVSVASSFDAGGEAPRAGSSRPIGARPPRHARRLRRTFSDGHSRNTSEEYLLDSCTLDSSFGLEDTRECSYRPRFSEERLIPDNFYPQRQEMVCSCPHTYYYTNTLPRDRRSDNHYSSEQNISGRIVTDRSSEELIVSQRSLDRKFKSNKPYASPTDRKKPTRTRATNKYELSFLPVKERSLDGSDYQFRNYRNTCSPGRCVHSSMSEPHAPQFSNRFDFSGSFERDAYDSQHAFANKCDATFDSFYAEDVDGGKSCARSLPPHFGDDERRFPPRGAEAKLDSRPRKSYGLGGRRVIVPDGCEQDEGFEALYNMSGCQCERCDHAGYPGGYCHSQVSVSNYIGSRMYVCRVNSVCGCSWRGENWSEICELRLPGCWALAMRENCIGALDLSVVLKLSQQTALSVVMLKYQNKQSSYNCAESSFWIFTHTRVTTRILSEMCWLVRILA